MSHRQTSLTRRHFLLAAGGGAAGAALAAKAARAPLAPAASIAAPSKRPGYRRTEHIGKYYRTAKL